MFAAWSEWQLLSLYRFSPRGDGKSRHESHSTHDKQFYDWSKSEMVYRGAKGPELVHLYASSLSGFKKTANATRSWPQMRWVGSGGWKDLSSIQVFPLVLLIKASQTPTHLAGIAPCRKLWALLAHGMMPHWDPIVRWNLSDKVAHIKSTYISCIKNSEKGPSAWSQLPPDSAKLLNIIPGISENTPQDFRIPCPNLKNKFLYRIIESDSPSNYFSFFASLV